jgi:hypothetical protein
MISNTIVKSIPFQNLIIMNRYSLFRYLCPFLVCFFQYCKSDGQSKLRNTDTAYLMRASDSDSVQIKMFGKGLKLAHDIPSALNPKYYIDSAIFLIPDARHEFTSYKKIAFIPRGGDPFVSGGITLKGDSITIGLFNYDDYHKKVYADVWNKKYLIKWQ